MKSFRLSVAWVPQLIVLLALAFTATFAVSQVEASGWNCCAYNNCETYWYNQGGCAGTADDCRANEECCYNLIFGLDCW